jgi:Na+/H+ antiporter NhaD/arsenite permease-like protein
MVAGSDTENEIDLDTNQIKSWRSIVTLIVFVLTNIIVLFPFHVSIYIPRFLSKAMVNVLVALRVIPPRKDSSRGANGDSTLFVRFRFPVNFVTAPLVADLFLLAILAIGRKEVRDGTLGANHISPIDIMVFFLSLAYIAISIDASGLIRYLAFKVLQWGGDVGHRLFFYLYTFFFALTAFIGNDPVILSGTAFLSYMTRVSSNIIHPRAWIYSQFAVANIGSAILVSSNPTNLVLAGAFNIKFINYTANMIVPVVVTAIVLFPFLLYFVFADESLIPAHIKMHELPEELRNKKPVNPNIPNARGELEEQESDSDNNGSGQLLSLEEIMNPFVDKSGAAFGAVIMAATLITILAVNASRQDTGEVPVFYITLPAAVVMFSWDIGFGWFNRAETRDIARQGRRKVELAQAERARRESIVAADPDAMILCESPKPQTPLSDAQTQEQDTVMEKKNSAISADRERPATPIGMSSNHEVDEKVGDRAAEVGHPGDKKDRKPTTLVSLAANAYRWSQETFPTPMTVLAHLPFALVPFAFCMFILVQGLVTKGWVPVFAYGWDHWVKKTGTIGAIGGMGFLSVILCNFAGTNIGTTILVCRVIQAWQEIHRRNGIPISDRTFWGTVYSMAIGVNYGAFSAAFSASLAGLLWRDILARKHIRVRSLDFARVNLPIIAISMTVGLVVLVGQIYIMRDNDDYIDR